MKMKKIILLIVIASLFTSCVAVKGYEKVFLNDPDMILASKKISVFEINFQAYREAAVGANGGKTGGGCGCN
jgi:hypothetical protein